MSKEVVRTEILREGVRINNSPDPAPVGTTTEFSRQTSFCLGSDGDLKLYLDALFSGNGVEAFCWDHPSMIFRPHHGSVKHKWTLTFGEHPSHNTEVFGVPEPLLKAVYLGHPTRDEIEPIISQQEEGGGETTIQLESYESGFRRAIVVASPVTQANFYGLDSDPRRVDNPDAGFDAKGIFLVEFGYLPEPHQELKARLSIATLADQDGLIRVMRTVHGAGGWREIGTLKQDNFPLHMERLAQMSIFFQTLPDNMADYPWIQTGFPLQVLFGLEDYLRAAGSNWHRQSDFLWRKELLRDYQFDWSGIIRNLHSGRVSIEKERIMDAAQLVLR